MIIVLAFMLACRGCAEQSPPPAFDPQDHFGGVFEARDAVIRGDLAALPEAGRSIDATLPAKLPEAAQAAVDKIHSAAGFLVVAEDVDEGADAVVELGLACGDCHRAMGRSFDAAKLVDGLEAPGSHAEAAEFGWAALVAGDAAQLEQALARLAELEPAAEDPVDPDAAELSPPQAYAAALARCSGCHAERGVVIKKMPGSP